MNTKSAKTNAAAYLVMLAAATIAFSIGAATLPRDEAGPAAEMPAEYRASAAAVYSASESVTEQKYPDADAVTIDERIHARYEADGSSVSWDDEWVKCLTEKGRRDLSSASYWLSLRYGDVTIQCVEIIDAQGNVRTVDFSKTLKEATDNDSMSANIYDPLDKNVSFRVPDIKVGEIRHVRFCRRLLKPRIKGEWADIELFEDTRPIIKTVVTVDSPAEKPLAHAALRHPLAGHEVVCSKPEALAGGRTLLRWSATNVPQAFPEPSMPSFYTQAQHLRLSTTKTWPDVSRWYWNLCKPHLDAGNEAMTNKVAELVKGLDGRMDKIRAIFRFVSQEIRYMGLTLEDTAPGYAPHDVCLTFDNRYGVCRDKAALLAEMLRIAGIPAYPVLIGVGPKLDPEVPMPYFNHAIVGVDAERPGSEREYILMDPTNEASKELCPAYLMNRSFLVAREDGEGLKVSPVEDPALNRVDVKTRGALQPDGSLQMKSEIRFFGYNDNLYRHTFLGMSPEERRTLFEGLVRAVAAGAEIDSFELRPSDLRDTEKQLEVDISFRAPESLATGETRDSLSVPFLSSRLSLARRILKGKTALEERRFTLALPLTASGEETVEIKLGANVGAVRRLPAAVSVGAGAGYSFKRSFEVNDGVLVARRSERLGAVEFEPNEYSDLREHLKDQETLEKPVPLFAKNSMAGADIRTVRNDRTVRLADARNYVVTNRFVREILTYDGKKSNSELTFTFNPEWENVEVVSATVESANGKTSAVTEKEINVMDAGWVGSAPRYPASKIMVVNLPAVEIGSVVDVTVARTVRNAPVPFHETYSFDSVNPIVSKKVSIFTPEKIFTAGIRAEFKSKPGEFSYGWSVEDAKCVPREPSQPPIPLWRPYASASAVRWNAYGEELSAALEGARRAGSSEAKALAKKLVEGLSDPSDRIAAIRKHVCRKVKVAGPGLLEVPFDRAFSAPDRALADGYASAADWTNLMLTMLEAAGFDSTYLLSADDANGYREMTELSRDGAPNPDAFSFPFVRAVWRGSRRGFLARLFGVGKDKEDKVFWIARENEFVPPEASSCFGDSYFDPASGEFGRVPEAKGDWGRRSAVLYRFDVRLNGATDVDVVEKTYGVDVGKFRRRYEEMLGEDRRRHYRALLGALSENATATKDLVTDVKGYPAERTYSAYIPGFAVADGDEITLKLPGTGGEPFDVGGPERKSPISVMPGDDETFVCEVVFPEGYTEVEHLPEAFSFANPLEDPAKGEWIECSVKSEIGTDRRLRVTVERRCSRRPPAILSKTFFPLFKEWNRISVSVPEKTITVRRRKGAK